MSAIQNPCCNRPWTFLKAQGFRHPPSSLRNHDITSSQDQAINMTTGDKEIHLAESCSGTLVIASKYSQLCRIADSIRSIGTVEGSTAGGSGSLRSVDKAEVMRISLSQRVRLRSTCRTTECRLRKTASPIVRQPRTVRFTFRVRGSDPLDAAASCQGPVIAPQQ